ncbi:MAG: gliding motility-associated protein GldE [Flavobacteriaceae bacterium]|jgi:gliding motility-associated protein GldE|nr:gliding motility-associated protein GldE [Flavobacteriaceae bacterium]
MDDPVPSRLFLTLLQINPEIGIYFVILVILLILSAITSGSEVAYFSLTQKDLDDRQGDFPVQVETISKIKKKSQQLISTVLVFNNLVNIGVVLISSKISEILAQTYHLPETARIILDLVVITFIILITGEVIPKIYARKNAFDFSRKTTGFIHVISKLCYPVTQLLLVLSKFLEKKLKKDKHISVNNLSQVLEIASGDEHTTDTEQKILEGIINFGNTETRQIMTPRVDVFSIPKDADFQTVVDLVHQNGYSRIPICGKDIDDIIGILYAKDLIQYIHLKDFNWHTLLKKPYFIPENKKSDDLLNDFQEKKMHLAIVVDEYGGTSGIVSLEDVIEEIVGDISDEFDEDEINYSKIDDNTYVFEGKISLIDFYKIMDIDETEFENVAKEADTLAGLVLEITEEFPKRMKKIHYKNFEFQVESLDRKRLKRIKVIRNPEENED